jgi:poly-gamma-glutamate system protein
LEAKRTTADPDMAALVVQMLTEAGVRSGDTVGAGFSGSFPALDLAVLAACEAMEVRCVYIASVGASTYGANQPEMTLPDMVCRLYRDGLLQTAPALVTPGGEDDCGLDMNQELLTAILERIRGCGVEVMEEPDFAANLERRMALYEQEGPITCFIGVGGNLSTSGLGESQVDWGVIQPNTIQSVDEQSGLLQRYNALGMPVIHLLNIKRLVADYQLPYDPQRKSVPGESAIYYETVYPRLPALLGLAGAAAILLFLRFSPEKEEL